VKRGEGLSGFPEWLPEQELVERHILDTIRRQFELHGFGPIRTRSVEAVEDLMGGGDTSKEIYGLRRLAGDDAEGESRIGLHFDLTLPLARYVTEKRGSLVFPFRRYQIQPAWRGERPQLGRYREFVQADADLISDAPLDHHADAELIGLLATTLQQLPIPPVKLRLNNRKLLEGYYRGLGIGDIAATLRAADKLDKIGESGVGKILDEQGLTGAQVEKVLAITRIEAARPANLARVKELGVEHPMLSEGLDELGHVLGVCQEQAPPEMLVGALHIARGLDYYTGTVVEGVLRDHDDMGAVCSGGRYDDLAGGGKQKLPGVGISIGVTRIMGLCLHLGLLKQERRTPALVYVVLHDEEARGETQAAARALRERGIPCVASSAARAYGKQIRAAERLGLRYVWFPARGDEPHQVKDIVSGEQQEADPASWRPADEAAELRFVE
jgi:histidyl-tRNA synthetase